MARRVLPFDDSHQKDRRRSARNPSTNTSAIDPYRQGVELSKPSDFANGIAKIHDGYNDQTGEHGVPQLVLGQERPTLRDDNSFLEGTRFDPLSLFERFTFKAPKIFIVDPNTGSTSGGTFVSLTGSNFFQTSQVQVAGSNVDFTYHDDGHITFTTVAHAAGSVDVFVRTPGGTDTVVNGYTYAASSVSIGSLAYASQGDTLGGEFFAISGGGFTGASAVKIDGVDVTAFTVANDTTIYAIAPAGSAGVKDVTVTVGGDTATGSSLWTYWDPTVEASCTTLVERGDYNEEVSGGGDWGLNWTARKGTSHFQKKYLDAQYSAFDDQGKEPRCEASSLRHLENGFEGINTLCNGSGAAAQLTVTIGIGYRTPNAPAPASNVDVDTNQILCHDGGGTTFATSHTTSGFGVGFWDGTAWKDVHGACNANEQNVGILRADTTGAGNIEARANGGIWDTIGSAAYAHSDLSLLLGVRYDAGSYSDVSVRFMSFANAIWDDATCAKLDTWARNRHGGKNSAGGSEVEIWYVTSDVIPTESGGFTVPGPVTVKGKGFTGATGAYICVGTGIVGCSPFTVVDDNTITLTPPNYDVAGMGTLVITGPSHFAQMVNAVEYYDVFNRAAEVRHRVGDVGSRTDDTVNVTALTNTGTSDSGTRDWQGNGTAGHLFSTGEDPLLFAADSDFGGKDSAGCNDGTGRAFVTAGNYNTGVNAPATVYTVLRVVDLPDTFWVLGYGGSSTGAFSMYGTTGTNAMNFDNGGTGIAVTLPDSTPSITAAVYDGTDSWATANHWLSVTHGSTAGGSGQETSLGFGDFGAAHPQQWKLAFRVVFSGHDDYPTRRKVIRALENYYQVAASAA